jgi:UDP-2,3-diacylglucosamine pyrophosphatase LpxH
MQFLHVSDLHVASNQVANSDIKRRLEYMRTQYGSHKLIVTGDIIDNEGETWDSDPSPAPTEHRGPMDWARMELPTATDKHLVIAKNAMMQAKQMLKPFESSGVYLCPGNHDFGLWGNFYDRKYAQEFDRQLMRGITQNGMLNPVGAAGENLPFIAMIDHDQNPDVKIVLYGLDSNLESPTPTDFACGEIGNVQLTALDYKLSTTNFLSMYFPTIFGNQNIKLVKIVFLHHHPWHEETLFARCPGIAAPVSVLLPIVGPYLLTSPTVKLKDSAAFLRLLERHGVDLLLFGHKHVFENFSNVAGVRYGAYAAGWLRDERRVTQITVNADGTVHVDAVTVTS